MNPRIEKVRLDDRDLLRICYLYYKEEKTQEEISTLFGISRFKVNRLLKEARDRGLVTIQIHDPLEKLTKMEASLAKKFGLRGAIVVRMSRYNGQSPEEQVGKVAAQYLSRIVRGYRVLGVSWGRTLYHVVTNVTPVEAKHLSVVQISGGLGTIEGTDTNILTMMLSQKLGATATVIQAPVIVRDRTTRDTLLQESRIREALARAREADLAILGIGVVNREGGLWKAGFLNEKDEVRLKRAGAVGALCGRFYTREGEGCETDLDDRIVGLSLEELRKIHHKIGIATGREKAQAISGALKGRLIDVLVTDEETAHLLLDEGEERSKRSSR
jgi:DNA-binding transcriptional regulator LsrR (DeoR family)